MSEHIHVLFVCSRNRLRSPTAERVFRSDPVIVPRSAGTASSARHKVTRDDLRWADVVLAMEAEHRDSLRAQFGADARNVPTLVLDIPDVYEFMDSDLVEELKVKVAGLLDQFPSP